MHLYWVWGREIFPALKKIKMVRLLLPLLHVIFVVGEGSQLFAPGSQNCPPLHVGHHVLADFSCTHSPSPAGKVCLFHCKKGYDLAGPTEKECQLDGTWTDADLPVRCIDTDECATENGFCSHICKNTPGDYKCECPRPLKLDPSDQRKCKADGVQLTCEPNHMKIALPKNLIHNLEHEHLSLLDPSCRATSNATHYILSTAVSECGTASHAYKNFIVFSNRVVESPNENSDVITTVGEKEVQVPFSCYYNNLEIVHAVGFKPVATKLHVYVKGRGEYALSLDIYKNSTYGESRSRRSLASSPKYDEDDFPIRVKLRQRVYLEASLDTREKDLRIFASNCCTTPMQDHEATIKFRHALIVEGCPREPSVQFHKTSDPTKVRFSFEVFKFKGDHDYVFVHCRVYVCDVNDNNSRCAQGCKAPPPASQDIVKQSKKIQTAKMRDKTPLIQSKATAHKITAESSKKDQKAKTSAEDIKQKVMKRSVTQHSRSGVLAKGDLSEGPLIFDVQRKEQSKRQPHKTFVHAKRHGIERDVKEKRSGRSSVPSPSNVLLVATTIASILALVGVAILGRKAMQYANNPYEYQPLVVQH